MSEVSEACRNFMSAYFSLGPGSEIISHKPHATLGRQRTAFDEAKAAGLVVEEDWNRFGSVRITATEKGREIARARFGELARAWLAPSDDGADLPTPTGEPA
jgi:hypothetical protein